MSHLFSKKRTFSSRHEVNCWQRQSCENTNKEVNDWLLWQLAFPEEVIQLFHSDSCTDTGDCLSADMLFYQGFHPNTVVEPQTEQISLFLFSSVWLVSSRISWVSMRAPRVSVSQSCRRPRTRSALCTQKSGRARAETRYCCRTQYPLSFPLVTPFFIVVHAEDAGASR